MCRNGLCECLLVLIKDFDSYGELIGLSEVLQLFVLETLCCWNPLATETLKNSKIKSHCFNYLIKMFPVYLIHGDGKIRQREKSCDELLDRLRFAELTSEYIDLLNCLVYRPIPKDIPWACRKFVNVRKYNQHVQYQHECPNCNIVESISRNRDVWQPRSIF